MGVNLGTRTTKRDGGSVDVTRRDAVREPLVDVVPLVYRELRAIAHRQLSRRLPTGGRSRTLETTALVNEAYLRLTRASMREWRERDHFLAVAAVAMQQVLIERARWKSRAKRGGRASAARLDEATICVSDPKTGQPFEVADALRWLAGIDRRLAGVVVCRFFVGMEEDEIATAFGVTVRTVQRDWAKARLLLRQVLVA